MEYILKLNSGESLELIPRYIKSEYGIDVKVIDISQTYHCDVVDYKCNFIVLRQIGKEGYFIWIAKDSGSHIRIYGDLYKICPTCKLIFDSKERFCSQCSQMLRYTFTI